MRAGPAPCSGAVSALGEALNELALFAGAGGGILGGHLLGWRTVCAVEWEPYAASVLVARQNDGVLPPFPIWDDVRTFDGRPWRGIVDVVSGGFPCQDISPAGAKEGIGGVRSGLWSEMARIVREVEPRWVFVENSADLAARGLGDVLADLAAMGFDAEWACIPASYAGAPQTRDRLWIVAYAGGRGCSRGSEWHVEESDAKRWHDNDRLGMGQRRAREATSRIRRMDDAVAAGVERLRAVGNGQVPAVAAQAFAELSARFG